MEVIRFSAFYSPSKFCIHEANWGTGASEFSLEVGTRHRSRSSMQCLCTIINLGRERVCITWPPRANERPFVRRFRGFLFPPGAPLRRGGVKSWGTPPNPRGGRPHFPPATHVRSSRGCPVGPVKVVASLRSAKRGRLATVSHVREARSVQRNAWRSTIIDLLFIL